MVFALQMEPREEIITAIIITINTALLPRGVCQVALGGAWHTLTSLRERIYPGQTGSTAPMQAVR